MTRLVNTVLIGLVTFVAVLAVVAIATPRLHALEGDSTGASLRVEPMEARWAAASDGSAAGSEILLDLALNNPTPRALAVDGLEYQARVGDRIVDEGQIPMSLQMAPRSNGTAGFTVHLPVGFASRWMADYLADDEASSLRITGSMRVRDGADLDEAPFQWSSRWTGGLLPALEAAARNCAEQDPTCLRSLALDPVGSRLDAGLVVENHGPDRMTVRSGAATVRLGNETVATGDVGVGASLPAGGEARFTLPLTLDPSRLDSWWPRHAAACEQSPAAVQVRLTIAVDHPATGDKPARTDVILVQWDFPATEFQTAFLCNHDP